MSIKQKFWVSWIQPTDDFRPLHFPPNKQVLGWWCSGYDPDGDAIICACVTGNGNSVGDQMRSATKAIEKEWPEAIDAEENSCGWRFFDQMPHDFKPGDRFPMSDWMLPRFESFESEAKQ